jgi:type II secretory pathway component GspD/PulD (secretin)
MADMICKMLLPNALGSSTGSAAGIKGSMTGAADGLALNEGTIACSYSTKATAGALSSLAVQNLAVSYYTSLGTVNVIGGSEQQVEMIKEFIAKTDKKQPQAYLEISIIELSETGSKTLDNTWQFWSKGFSATFAGGAFGTNPSYPTFVSGGSSYDVLNSADPTDVAYTIRKFTGAPMLTYAINYLIENRKGRVVANPRILITNGQESTIDLTSDYVKTVKSEVLAGTIAGAVQRTYEIGDDNGIKVSITPFISPDGYVTLNIAPDYATIKERIYVDTPTESGKTVQNLDATLLQRRNLDLKNVRIKDGETLVIGGMIREDESKSVKKIPVLGDLPGIGMFFRSTGTDKAKEEMIIMITPKIISDNEDTALNRENL